MILATFGGTSGEPTLGVVRRGEGTVVDLQAAQVAFAGAPRGDFGDMQAFIDGGDAARSDAQRLCERVAPDAASVRRLADVRLLVPLAPRQMRDFSVFEVHMRQAGAAMARLRQRRTGGTGPLPSAADIQLPEVFYRQPVYYKTNRMSVIGHDHDVRWPSFSSLLDYELEFGIVLGKGGRDIPIGQAREHIFGYTIFNDFSARDAQEYEMNAPLGPAKGKDFDTGNALGPWIVTADEIPDPYGLEMVARVNGEEWSRGNSRDMVHRFERMIEHVSQDESLYAGEFFGSGTVGGGSGLELDRWLADGDVVELEVDGIGVLRNRVVRNGDSRGG